MKRFLFVTLLPALALLLTACGGSQAPAGPVEVTIELSEFQFTPSKLELRVGQQVTLHLKNVGEKDHELMIGKDVKITNGLANGFETDFFASIQDSMQMSGTGAMFMNGGVTLAGDMGDMNMNEGGDSGGDMAMSDSGGEEHNDGGADAEHGGNDHTGFMVMLPASGETPAEATLTFTVTEDMVGTWEMGCFQEDGQHYDDGMVGKIVVKH